jgi:predicted Zn-ribbon and HTH transcriptional regulator
MQKFGNGFVPLYADYAQMIDCTVEDLDNYGRWLGEQVRAWKPSESIEDLRDLLVEVREVLGAVNQIAHQGDGEERYGIDMSDLPSAPIPEEVVGYPVWAVDKRGMALVGPDADEIENIEVVRAVCEEYARRMKGIPLRCHKCGHIWMYRGRSHYRTTCPACHITVYLDKCKIVRGGSGE